jgi:DNA-binding MltR family transcriptional regulator
MPGTHHEQEMLAGERLDGIFLDQPDFGRVSQNGTSPGRSGPCSRRQRSDLACEFRTPGGRRGADHRDCISYRHSGIFAFHGGNSRHPLAEDLCSCCARIEPVRTPANSRSLQRDRRSNVAASASPKQILRRRILFASVHVPNLDIAPGTTETTDFFARRRVSIGAVAESALVRANLVNDAKACNEVLDNPNGALSTFSSRIEFAYLLGRIGPAARRELHLIRKIRNEFAHDYRPLGFADAVIADRCQELRAHLLIPTSRPRASFARTTMGLLAIIHCEIAHSKHAAAGMDLNIKVAKDEHKKLVDGLQQLAQELVSLAFKDCETQEVTDRLQQLVQELTSSVVTVGENR